MSSTEHHRAAEPEPSVAERPVRNLAGLLCVLALAACANTPAADAPVRVAEGAQPEPRPQAEAQAPAESSAGFSADVLYKLLVAEFAGRRNRLDLAVSNYLDAARETRDPEIAERAVRVAVFARDQEHGIEAAKLWSELAPESLDAKQVYAALLIRAGRIDEAVARLEELLAQSRHLPEQGFNLVGDMLSRERDQDAAMQVMERLVAERHDDPNALFAFAQFAARIGKFDRSAELLSRLLELEPTNSAAVILYAQVLQRQGDTGEALKVLSDILDEHPEEQTIRMTYARLLVDAKRYEEARDQFQRLADESPENADVRFALGLLLLQTNHPERAREQFRHLIALGERTLPAWFYLGQIAETLKNPDEAIEAYRHVDEGEHYLGAQIRIAALLADKGHIDQAREHLHALPRRNLSEAVRLYRAEAEILAQHDMLDEAMTVYDDGLEQYPGDTDLLYGRAMLAEKLDRLDVLEADLRQILASEPNNADALNALGYTLADRTDRYQEALELIQKALELKPDDYYVVDSMGWVMYRMGRYEEALKYLRRALELNYDTEVAAHLGEVLWVTGRKQEAREVWDTALKSTPEDEHLLEVIKRFSK